ncbi:MAG: HEPN domain-containing protein [Anaerolineales bacterium]|nr:HEPN domain-containing protein [Anaerolineales bacterium]
MLARRSGAAGLLDLGFAIDKLMEDFALLFLSFYTLRGDQSMQAPNLSRLKPNERRAIEAFVEALRRDVDGRLLLLVLFGSRARGDDMPDADIDFLVVTEDEPRELDRRRSTLTSALGIEHNVLLNTLLFRRERWSDFAQRRAAFWQNAQRDGMLMLRSPRLPEALVASRAEADSHPPDHRPEVTAYLANAWQALRTAESEFNQGRDYLVVANRAYYAIFYAANAILATQGLQRSKHPVVMALFREKYVIPGTIEASYMRDYEEAMERRHMSDYNLNSAVNADYVRVELEAAQRFTSRVEHYLSRHGFTSAA